MTCRRFMASPARTTRCAGTSLSGTTPPRRCRQRTRNTCATTGGPGQRRALPACRDLGWLHRAQCDDLRLSAQCGLGRDREPHRRRVVERRGDAALLSPGWKTAIIVRSSAGSQSSAPTRRAMAGTAGCRWRRRYLRRRSAIMDWCKLLLESAAAAFDDIGQPIKRAASISSNRKPIRTTGGW